MLHLECSELHPQINEASDVFFFCFLSKPCLFFNTLLMMPGVWTISSTAFIFSQAHHFAERFQF